MHCLYPKGHQANASQTTIHGAGSPSRYDGLTRVGALTYAKSWPKSCIQRCWYTLVDAAEKSPHSLISRIVSAAALPPCVPQNLLCLCVLLVLKQRSPS